MTKVVMMMMMEAILYHNGKGAPCVGSKWVFVLKMYATCTQRKIRPFQYFQLHRVFSLQASDFILNIVYIVNYTICICRQYRTLT